MDNKENFFYVNDGKGKKIKCRGLFTFHSDDYDRDYILYTDDVKDKRGNSNVYASIYDPADKDFTLTDIEDDEEFKMLIEVFQEANKG